MKHVMVDLETWGVNPGAALRSIGACVFDPLTGEIGPTFYANVDKQSCLDAGLVTEPRTEKFWEDQSDLAKSALELDPRPLGEALALFFGWWTEYGGTFLWSHGAAFDAVLLDAAANAVAMNTPWKFWNVRCCRTVLALGNVRPDRTVGVHHHALDDAKAQAAAVATVLRGWPLNVRDGL